MLNSDTYRESEAILRRFYVETDLIETFVMHSST